MSQIEEKVRKVLKSLVEEKYPHANAMKFKPMKSMNANYGSHVLEATVITAEENIELFVKVSYNRTCFDTESKFCSSFSRAFEKLQNRHGISDQRFVFPKYYKSSAIDGVYIIILENLQIKGYDSYNRFEFEGIDWKYASNCVEKLATYHALSLALNKENPQEFKKAGEAMKVPSFKGPEWNGAADAALAVVDEVDRRKLLQLFEGATGLSKLDDLYNPVKTAVIVHVHGDFTAPNLMHKKEKDEVHVVLVDYELARLGCPVADLIFFIVLSTDQQFRQQYFHQLLEHYYEQLAQAMRRLGLVPEETYGRGEFESDLKVKLPLGLCVAATCLPFALLPAAQARGFGTEWFVPPTSELFAERFRDLVDDFKQWGII